MKVSAIYYFSALLVTDFAYAFKIELSLNLSVYFLWGYISSPFVKLIMCLWNFAFNWSPSALSSDCPCPLSFSLVSEYSQGALVVKIGYWLLAIRIYLLNFFPLYFYIGMIYVSQLWNFLHRSLIVYYAVLFVTTCSRQNLFCHYHRFRQISYVTNSIA